jgi:hypothetical protein
MVKGDSVKLKALKNLSVFEYHELLEYYSNQNN